MKETNLFTGNDTVTTKYNRFEIGGFFREYKKLAKDFYFFGQVDGAAIIANQTSSYKLTSGGDVKVTQRGGFISLTPGISYHVFKKMQLEITIPNILSTQYLKTKFVSQNPQIKNSKSDQFMFYSNLNNNTSFSWLGVGFRFFVITFRDDGKAISTTTQMYCPFSRNYEISINYHNTNSFCLSSNCKKQFKLFL